ncbi:ral guanine nucleotide dissociation stimulator-like 2 isoform X2 [Polypterus senegalus]|uniref:ral guanine nucleotide dissociation stimulator-like 2 isoform X2 n=1 Tax=Polypterus senegalus TaxID=55291 RepID=UPI0019623906|nr:ral guanine nucleotide dissociation stimulator-like 2 isoform X2 [Polypterus senegalus]
MHPRGGMRASDLPGEDESNVTLSSFRPRDPDILLSLEKRQHESSNSQGTSQGTFGGSSGSMKTKWYCSLETPPPTSVTEECDDGAIYTVTVKQLQLQQSTSKDSAGLSETCRIRVIKAGTLDKLIQHLLDSFHSGDSSYTSVFLATYRAFSNTKVVLTILLEKIEYSLLTLEDTTVNNTQKQLELKSAVSSVFSTWFEDYPEDFHELRDPTLLDKLYGILQREFRGCDLKRRAKKLLQSIKSNAADGKEKAQATKSAPPLCSPPEYQDSDFSYMDFTGVLDFPSSLIAEQLTMIETELFVKVVPYHCLGSIWTQRDKKGMEHICPSVRATVRQFNKLINAVMSTCLCNTQLRSQQRARILEKWIQTAEECRARKNFSSLYAIISALNSNSVHRLKKTWEETNREAVRSYEELADIFSDKDNYSQSRELLKEHAVHGTVPYLGTFLTDLVMLDTAVKDHLENGYINFDKRRKEFEIISQIRLLQSSCKNLVFERNENILKWFDKIPQLSEAESYKLSCEIESHVEIATPTKAMKPTVVITHCTDLLTSIAGTAMPMGFVTWDRPGLGTPRTSNEGSLESPSTSDGQLKPSNPLLSRLTKHTKSPSVSSLDTVVSTPTSVPSLPSPPSTLSPPPFVKSHRRSASCGSSAPVAGQKAESDIRIIRVGMNLEDGNMYRSILVNSNDKAPSVISKALEKHSLSSVDVSAYELVQMLPDGKELIIPPLGNVFYAMNSSSVDFLLRKKSQAPSPQPQQTNNEPGATFPRIKKGFKIARNLF